MSRREAVGRRRRSAAVSVLLLAPIVLLLGGCDREPGPPHRAPHRIILVSMDTVRADRVTGFGSAHTTPHLAAVARQGTRFSSFYAASSYTIPSHASIFTGLDPLEHGLVADIAHLSPGVATLAEVLGREGYRTAAFHEGGFVAARFGFDHGFNRYTRLPRVSAVDGNLPRVLRWIRSMGESRYFLFLHTYAAHYPYGGITRDRAERPDRWKAFDIRLEERGARNRRQIVRSLSGELRETAVLFNHLARDRHALLPMRDSYFGASFRQSPTFEEDRQALLTSYDERIRLIDRAIGRIRALLERRGQWEDTLLIVTSDHGESFFEHQRQRHDYVPFEEVLRIPLVVSYPRLLAEGCQRVVEGAAWHLDLMPTILGMVGATNPNPSRGMNLTEAMLGREAIPEKRAVFPAVLRPAHRPQEPLRRVAIRGAFKYIEGHEWFGDPDGLLFDLRRDPGEHENLRATRSGEFRSLAAASSAFIGQLERISPVHQSTGEPLPAAGAGAGSAPLTEEEREQLRALGYLEVEG